MLSVGVQSSVNSLFGMSWQPGTSSPADRLIGVVLRVVVYTLSVQAALLQVFRVLRQTSTLWAVTTQSTTKVRA